MKADHTTKILHQIELYTNWYRGLGSADRNGGKGHWILERIEWYVEALKEVRKEDSNISEGDHWWKETIFSREFPINRSREMLKMEKVDEPDADGMWVWPDK